MLIPAIVKKDEIKEKIASLYYTEDMTYLAGYRCNWMPNIQDCPDESTFQFAIVNDNLELLGYLGYTIDWYSLSAFGFVIISFDKGNILVGEALFTELEKIIKEYKIHRIEWRMISGNPAERAYDKFLEKYHGTKHILKDVFKDQRGNYHDDIIYEIIIKK